MVQSLKYQPTGGGIHGGEAGLRLSAGGRRTWMPWGPIAEGQVEGSDARALRGTRRKVRMRVSGNMARCFDVVDLILEMLIFS
jgi:hypothetical protein